MNKEKETRIKKICLVVGGKEIELSVEEAKELMQILDETFGEKEKVYIPSPYPIYVERPYRWTYTYWTSPTYSPSDGTYTISCGDTYQDIGLRTYT